MRTHILPLLAALLAFAAPASHAASARVQPTGTYGVDDLVLENDFLRATIAPHLGGKVRSLVWKATGAELAAQGADGGLFRDIIAAQDHPGELYAAGYLGAVGEPGPATASVKVWFDGQSRLSRGLRFQRTYVLREGSPFLDVQYDISSRSLARKTLGLRVHTFPALAGEKSPQPYLPLAAGSESAKFNQIRGDFTDGWLATVSPATGSAVVSIVEYDAIERGFQWEGFTQEWFYRTLTFLPGQSFHSVARLAYVTGAANVIGADRRMVLSSRRDGSALTVTLHALEPVQGSVGVELVDPVGHAAQETLPAQEVRLRPGEWATIRFALPALPAGAARYARVVVKAGEAAYAAPINLFGVKDLNLPIPEKRPVVMAQGPVPRLALEPNEAPVPGEVRGKGAVKVSTLQETTDTVKAGALQGQRVSERSVTLSNDKTEASLHYSFYEGPPKGLLAAGEFAGPGLRGKGALPFYHGGFIDVRFDSQMPLRQHRAVIVPRPGIGKGGVDFVWDLPQAKVTLRVLLLAGDERLYCRLKLEKKGEYKSVTVRLLTFPGWFTHKHDRWVLTPRRDWQHAPQGADLTADGGWMLLYDKVDDPALMGAASRGPAAVLWDPREVSGVRVQSDNYSITPEFTLAASQAEVHLALWGFPYLPWQTARDRLRAEAPAIGALLAKGPALAGISRGIGAAGVARAGGKVRVLQLSTWRNPNGLWAEHDFPELKLYAKPARTTYPGDVGKITFAMRYWFQGIKNLQYFLRNDPEIAVDTAYEDDLLGKLSRLYDYDVLAINDLDLSLLDPFAADLRRWVESGRGILFLGGFGAFGGAGGDYGTYQGSALEGLLPVTIARVPDWDENIRYQEGKPSWGPGFCRAWPADPEDEDQHEWTRQGPALAIEEGWAWLGRDRRVRVPDGRHPIVAGLPLSSLSPGYHRVAPRPGSTNVAFVGDHPVIATAPAGKGRSVALALNDTRRLYFWPHTPQLYRQAVLYAAGRDAGAGSARSAGAPAGRGTARTAAAGLAPGPAGGRSVRTPAALPTGPASGGAAGVEAGRLSSAPAASGAASARAAGPAAGGAARAQTPKRASAPAAGRAIGAGASRPVGVTVAGTGAGAGAAQSASAPFTGGVTHVGAAQPPPARATSGAARAAAGQPDSARSAARTGRAPAAPAMPAAGGAAEAGADPPAPAPEGGAQTASAGGPQVRIAKDHKRHFTRGESIQPQLRYAGLAPAPGLVWKVELIDSQGIVRRQATAPATAEPVRVPLPVGRLAFGEYRYVASLVAPAPRRSNTPTLQHSNTPAARVLSRATAQVFICPDIALPEYAVGWWGLGLHWHGSYDCYETLAAIAGLREYGNLALLLGPETGRIAEVCDRALGLGMPLGSYAVACSYHWPKGKYGTSNRTPEKLQFLRERGAAMAPLAKHPALCFIYTDDEGQGGDLKESDLPEYRRRHGADPPAKPWEAPIEEQMKVANFNLETGTQMWGTARDAYKKSNPRWTVGMLESVGNRPWRGGGWFWECFNNQDLNLIDLYPTTVGDSDQDFFWLNVMRCVARRNGKPTWVVLGEYRNDFNSLKMQWWLMMGAGLDGYQWFCTDAAMESGHLDQLKPYHQWAMRYGPLLRQARKPASRVAILQSKAVWSRFVEDPEKNDYARYRKQCTGAPQQMARELYAHDLYPDVITEEHLRDGSAGGYDCILLPAVDVLEKDALAALSSLAREKVVMADAETTVVVPGAVPFDAAALRQRIAPALETPDPLVYAEPLKAGELECAVVYNHQDRPMEKAVVKARLSGVKRVRDLFRQQDVPFSRSADGISLSLSLGAFDGAFLAFLREEPKGVSVAAPASVKLGTDIRARIAVPGVTNPRTLVPSVLRVLDPQGRETRYGATALLPGGRILFSVPTAVNDPWGVWRIRVKEMLTGAEGEARVSVRQ